ncbi:LINE-1 retrotransposable element ORF2 protein [Linum perenne]
MIADIFCWNCCGAGHKSFLTCFKEYAKSFNFAAAIIVEPKISNDKADRVINKLGFPSHFRVDATGFKGGVWIAWHPTLVSFDIIQSGQQFIHVKGVLQDGSNYFITAVYASPTATERVLLWDRIRSLSANMDDPWVIMGDFNSILSAEDKRGGALFNRARNKSFIDLVDVCGLSDLPFQGPRFTWARNNVSVRLDRALVNCNWLNRFPESKVLHLHKLKSDHRPIVLRSHNQVYSPNSKPFRFISAWLTHASFSHVIKRKWCKGTDLPFALNNLSKDLCQWNKFVFGNIFRRKKRLTEELKRAENRCVLFPSQANAEEEARVRAKLESVLWQEESLWLQKSRAKWVTDGDRNTKLFHLSTLRRRAFNRINRLRNADGVWVESQPELLSLAMSYYKEFYTSSGNPAANLQGFSAKIPADASDDLGKDITAEEVALAIKSIGALKAPGKDGFCPIFFQRCWQTVGPDFCSFISNCFRRPELIAGINETLITLIPKIHGPITMSDFRPISLCNVGYKSLTKCIANRLKGFMGGLTHPSQTSFVPGRHITDNILIVQEVVHSLSRRKGKNASMVIKVDLSKAYDKIEWSFVRDTLEHVDLPHNLIEVIMKCVSSPTFQILWNGCCSDSFSPTRGLRQGCPLSPYLFTLCMERLSRMISEAVISGTWKPVKLVRNGVPLSHVFFADDLVFMGQASCEQAAVILDIVNRFCVVSGQTINKDKSRVFFSSNMNRRTSRAVSDLLGIAATQDLGRYLGVPLLHGRVKHSTYDFILSRLDVKLAGWKANNLSLAGRVTLASSVLNAIPSYVMQTALLPASICEGIDRKIRYFIWGSVEGARKIHNINWETVCKPKNLGGLGLRSARELNKAFIMKIVWGLIDRPSELWAQVLSSKYLKRSESGYVLARKTGFSAVWRGMMKVWPDVINGIQWSVRDGKTTKFWTDRWLDSGILLIDHAINVQGVNPSLLVSQATKQDGSWDFDFLSNALPHDVLLQVVGMSTPADNLGKDSLVWGLEVKGHFQLDLLI